MVAYNSGQQNWYLNLILRSNLGINLEHSIGAPVSLQLGYVEGIPKPGLKLDSTARQ